MKDMINEELQEKLDVMFEVCSELLELQKYDIVYEQGVCWSKSAAGQIKLENDYLFHRVKINPYKHIDDESLLNTVLHECIHGMLSGYDTFLNVVLEGTSSKKQRKILQRMYTHFDEQNTVRLTRILFPIAWDRYQERLKNLLEESEDE